jgi:hypothetical protein
MERKEFPLPLFRRTEMCAQKYVGGAAVGGAAMGGVIVGGAAVWVG